MSFDRTPAATLAATFLLLHGTAVLAQEAPNDTKAGSWEGAVGLAGSYRPEYSGASAQAFKLTPVFFLRYGRFAITNAGGLTTRQADDVIRGVSADLVRSDHLRVSAALRFDPGRSETASDDLRGMGNVRRTVRVRLGATYRLDGPWRLGASWTFDALGRGGGNGGDLSLAWEHALGADTRILLSTSLSFAGDRYLQTWYGVTPEQSARSGYADYAPGNGLRDVAAGASLRHEFSRNWVGSAGIGASQLLGPAAASPLSKSRFGWGANAAVAWRF